ncbi:MAG TPA: hypothetical protein VMT86_06930 [Bryobacteraceae bacterium]|nr:hypothetical protein [Bryobacteraceae bacterium]
MVEGHGECESVPILIRSIAHRFDPSLAVQVPHPVRVPKSRLLKPGELERAVVLAAGLAGRDGGILVVLDSDDDCPAELAPKLLARTRAARGDLPSAVVLANKQFESWFLAAANSLRGHGHLPADLEPPAEPESIRGAKEWLEQRAYDRSYSANVDQPSLTSMFSLDLALRAPSLDQCYREVLRLLETLRSGQ